MSNPSISPRVYLIGKLLPVMCAHALKYEDPSKVIEDLVEVAISIVDMTLDKMQWPSGKPVDTDPIPKKE